MSAPLYRIRDYAEQFDSGEARKIKKLIWVQMPNRHDGLGMRRLARREDGAALFGIWCLIVQISSQNAVHQRGLLISGDKPLTAEDLFVKTGFAEEDFAAALEYFSNPKVGWLVPVNPEEIKKSPETPGDYPETPGDYPGTSGKSPATDRQDRQDRQDRTGEDRQSPIPPEKTGAASPQGGEAASPEDKEALHHFNRCVTLAKGLREELLDDPEFAGAWCEWITHLRTFTPAHAYPDGQSFVRKHREQLNEYTLADAIWALDEGIALGLRKPADPAKRPKSADADNYHSAAPVPANLITEETFDPADHLGAPPPPEKKRAPRLAVDPAATSPASA